MSMKAMVIEAALLQHGFNKVDNSSHLYTGHGLLVIMGERGQVFFGRDGHYVGNDENEVLKKQYIDVDKQLN